MNLKHGCLISAIIAVSLCFTSFASVTASAAVIGNYHKYDNHLTSNIEDDSFTPINNNDTDFPAADKEETVEDNINNSTKHTESLAPTFITMNKSSLNLGTGESFIVKVSTDNNAYYGFSTTDSSVAIVDSYGKITAKGCGTATIKCTTDNNLIAKCSVTVKNISDSVSLNKKSLTVGVGDSFDFNSYVPSNTSAYFRNYSTDSSKIADISCSGGILKANSVGTTKITCTLSNGEKATCKVTVKNKPNTISLNKKCITLKVGKSYTLSECTNKGSYALHFNWKSSNSSIAKVSSTYSNKASICATKPGYTFITVSTYNGVTSKCLVKVVK